MIFDELLNFVITAATFGLLAFMFLDPLMKQDTAMLVSAVFGVLAVSGLIAFGFKF